MNVNFGKTLTGIGMWGQKQIQLCVDFQFGIDSHAAGYQAGLALRNRRTKNLRDFINCAGTGYSNNHRLPRGRRTNRCDSVIKLIHFELRLISDIDSEFNLLYALEISVERLGFFLFDFPAGFARCGN
jgi:hypothetical protein